MSDLKADFKSSIKRPRPIVPKEMLLAGVEYACTINPPEHPDGYDLFDFQLRDQLDREAIVKMRQTIVKLNQYADIELYIEFSPIGRLHYHGTFKVKKGQEVNVKRYVIPALASIAQICLKYITDQTPFDDGYKCEDQREEKDFETWKDYCTKESKYVYEAGLPVSINNRPIMEGGSAANIITNIPDKKVRSTKREILNN